MTFHKKRHGDHRIKGHTPKPRKRAKGSTASGAKSPRIMVSYGPEDFRVLTAFAHAKGKTVAQVLRDALFAYLLPIRGNYPAYLEGVGNGDDQIQESRTARRSACPIGSAGRAHDEGGSGESVKSGADHEQATGRSAKPDTSDARAGSRNDERRRQEIGAS